MHIELYLINGAHVTISYIFHFLSINGYFWVFFLLNYDILKGFRCVFGVLLRGIVYGDSICKAI